MKTRIRFTKTGSLKFIGHLDLMRFFQKAIRRAKLDVSYSKGYSPHQLMSFASPLGVGVTSDGDYLDIEFDSLPNCTEEELLAHMNRFMTEEIFVTQIKVLSDKSKTSMALLKAADYMIAFKENDLWQEDLAEKFTEYAERPEILIVKKTKRNEKEMDVKPYLLKYDFTFDEFLKKTGTKYPKLHYEIDVKNNLYLQLTSGSAINIKPNLIVDDFLTFCVKKGNPYSYQVHRLEMYFDETNNGKCMEESDEAISDSKL